MIDRRIVLAGFAALAAPRTSCAQGFPPRAAIIVVPYPPGGPIDALARMIAQESAVFPAGTPRNACATPNGHRASATGNGCRCR
jgi:tripartite-type tricarboxylate transporter receptor subunit TctC